MLEIVRYFWKDFKLAKSSKLNFLVLSPKDRVKCSGLMGGGGGLEVLRWVGVNSKADISNLSPLQSLGLSKSLCCGWWWSVVVVVVESDFSVKLWPKPS